MTGQPNKSQTPNDGPAVKTTNATDMTTEERHSEIAEILARGVTRLINSEKQRPNGKKAPKSKLPATTRIVQVVQTASQSRSLLSEDMLADRWLCSASRLQRWRSAKSGPAYLKIGGKVLYRLADVEAYESSMRVETNNPRIQDVNETDDHSQAEATRSEKPQES